MFVVLFLDAKWTVFFGVFPGSNGDTTRAIMHKQFMGLIWGTCDVQEVGLSQSVNRLEVVCFVGDLSKVMRFNMMGNRKWKFLEKITNGKKTRK